MTTAQHDKIIEAVTLMADMCEKVGEVGAQLRQMISEQSPTVGSHASTARKDGKKGAAAEGIFHTATTITTTSGAQIGIPPSQIGVSDMIHQKPVPPPPPIAAPQSSVILESKKEKEKKKRIHWSSEETEKLRLVRIQFN
jgi:hypothetical protein